MPYWERDARTPGRRDATASTGRPGDLRSLVPIVGLATAAVVVVSVAREQPDTATAMAAIRAVSRRVADMLVTKRTEISRPDQLAAGLRYGRGRSEEGLQEGRRLA